MSSLILQIVLILCAIGFGMIFGTVINLRHVPNDVSAHHQSQANATCITTAFIALLVLFPAIVMFTSLPFSDFEQTAHLSAFIIAGLLFVAITIGSILQFNHYFVFKE